MDYIITKKNGIEYLQFKRLLEYDIKNAITLKTGNFDVGSIDNFSEHKEKFIENYKRLCDSLDLDYKNILRPGQEHTDVVEVIEEKKTDDIEIYPEYLKGVDGLITSKKDIILSLTFADCTPLIFFDTKKKVIANVHSGWKGTLQRIGAKTVEKMMNEFSCNPEDIICCIGPCIRECHFEVGKDVEEMFYNEFKDLREIDEMIKDNHIDTTKINTTVLQEIGIKPINIIDTKLCTACEKERFCSYRGDKGSKSRFTSILSL